MKCKYCGKERKLTDIPCYKYRCEHCSRPDAADDSNEMADITKRNRELGDKNDKE